MTAWRRLLKCNIERLEVWETVAGVVCVKFQNCEVKGAGVLIDTFGRGLTFEDACENYLNEVSGKTLVFNACSENRKEVTVL